LQLYPLFVLFYRALNFTLKICHLRWILKWWAHNFSAILNFLHRYFLFYNKRFWWLLLTYEFIQIKFLFRNFMLLIKQIILLSKLNLIDLVVVIILCYDWLDVLWNHWLISLYMVSINASLTSGALQDFFIILIFLLLIYKVFLSEIFIVRILVFYFLEFKLGLWLLRKLVFQVFHVFSLWMRLFYNLIIVLVFFLVFVINLLIRTLSCGILSFFSFFILAKYIFSKNLITLLVFPLSCRFRPKFRALLIFYYSKISFVVL